jgi:hypothetical protein
MHPTVTMGKKMGENEFIESHGESIYNGLGNLIH